ncbi:hypothetical protein TEA_013014 [Camellia sinensis var. sinensis]|uniref:Uncharacterized protein n=1 Tax=Camellia sinensis var. sinensis TaxID=542762 RepID=A0A4V3WN80_CAMSN|nr:hypothetical protein TEA_013014 [Camellia sinensis var. sinensis]
MALMELSYAGCFLLDIVSWRLVTENSLDTCLEASFNCILLYPYGVSAVKAFYELLSQSHLSILHPEENKPVAPVELCPILKTLYKMLITRELSLQAILQALRDENMNDPRERIEIAQSHVFYRPSLLGQEP